MCNDRSGRHARLANQFFVGSPFSRWAAEARSSCRYSRGQKAAALGRAPQTGKRPFFLSANRQAGKRKLKRWSLAKSWMSRGCRGHCISQPADWREWGLFLRKPGWRCFSGKWLRIDTELLYYIWLTRYKWWCEVRRRKRVVVCLRFVTLTTQLVPTLGLRRISSCSAISTCTISRFGSAQKNKSTYIAIILLGQMPVSQNLDL